MQITKAAKRYASALLSLANEEKTTEQVLVDIQALLESIQASADLNKLFASPIVSIAKKVAIVQELFSDKVSKTTLSFLVLVIEKGRDDMILEILYAFIAAYDVANGIVKVEVKSAFELSEDESSALIVALEKSTGKKIVPSYNVDSSLMGGVAVRINDTVYDGTIRHKIKKLEHLFNTPV